MRAPIRPRVSAPTVTTFTGYGAGTPAGFTYGADTGAITLASAFRLPAGGSLVRGRVYLTSNTGAVVASDLTASGSTPLEFALFAAADAAPGATGSPLFTPVALASVVLDSWNEFTLGSPFALAASTIYYASVFLPQGRYGARSGEFTADVTSGPIVFPANSSGQGTSGEVRNGAFTAGGAIAAPVNQFGQTWYGVDVVVS